MNFHVIARVPFYGEAIDDKIKDQYTPGEYIVTAELIGPKFDKDSQEWSAADKGLVTVKRKLVTGQAILAGVSTQGLDNENINYAWTSNEGCHIDAGHSSDVVTVSRNEAGVCTLDVVAYDKDKRRLGSDQVSFSINPQDGDLGSFGNKNKADTKDQKDKQDQKDQQDQKDKEQKQKEAQQAIKKAEELASQGKYEEAAQQAAKAAELDPENKDIKNKADNIKNQKEAVDAVKKAEELASQGKYEEAAQQAAKAEALDPENKDIKVKTDAIKKQNQDHKDKIEKIETAIKEGNLEEAEKTIKELEKDTPQSTAKNQLKDKLTTAKKTLVEKTLTKSKANIKKGDLQTAIKDMEQAIKHDPDNIELKELFNKTKKDKEQISTLKKQFDEAVKKGDYATADKILEQMKNHSHYDPEVQEANSTLSNKSFNKRNELNYKLNNVRTLISKGEIDQAIAEAEAILSESQNVNDAESITATTRNLLNDLKNKKKNCEANIAEAERLISEEYYENAKNILNSLKAVLPNYKPVLDLETKLNEILNQQSATKNKQKELLNQAFAEIRLCNYDKAVELANQAKELDPDNADIARGTYDANNKNVIFHQDLDRAKLYLNRGDIDFAKEELAKHSSYCTANPDYIAVQELINDYYKGKSDEITAKVAEVKALVDAKEYTKASNMAKEITSTLHPTGELQKELSDFHTYALKKLSEKQGAINYFNISQTHYNQYNYEGCLKQLDILDGQYPDCWEPSDDWPQKIAQLRQDALDKYNRVNELAPQVKKAATEDGWSTIQLQDAYKLSEELLSLKPNNYDYGAYKEAIKKKLAMAANQKVDQAYASLQEAENLYNQNKMGEAQRSFENAFSTYDSILDKNDSRYIHYRDVYNKLLSSKQKFEAITNKYSDVFGVFEGKSDINKLNRTLVQKMLNAVKELTEILPNKQLAAEAFGNKLTNAANEFNQLIDKQIENCKQIALTPDKPNTLKICTMAHNMDPNNPEVNAILDNYKKIISEHPEDKDEPQYPSYPEQTVKINDNGNTGGCGFTDTARFTISKPSFVNQIEVWFNWPQGQTALPYTLHFPNGQTKNGTLYRKGCDAYQTSWCNASDNPNMVFESGNYAVTVNPGRICQNSGTGGNGTIRIYSGPAKQNTGPIVNNTATTPSKPDIGMTEQYLNSQKNQGINQTHNTQNTNSNSGSAFDGHYTGPCRFYGATGNCTITIDIKNNQITGNMRANIQGDNVSASISGAVQPPGPQYSQKSATLSASITNGTIKDNTYHRTVGFAGKLTGNVYTTLNKANGTFETKLNGKSGGPKGEWKTTKGGSTVSATSTNNSTSSNLAPRVIFINKSNMPVHFYGQNESCSPNNKVLPGAKHVRALMAGYTNSSLRPFYAGRNGSTIAKVDVPTSLINQKGQTVYVIFDSSGRLFYQK